MLATKKDKPSRNKVGKSMKIYVRQTLQNYRS